MKLSTGSSTIANYTPVVGGVPDRLWQDPTSGQPGEFGYNVMASTSGEVDQSFMNNTTNCNAGTNETYEQCWMAPSNVAETIINSTTANNTSTSTIKFKVAVPNNPSPVLPSGFYVATATLTALTNP